MLFIFTGFLISTFLSPADGELNTVRMLVPFAISAPLFGFFILSGSGVAHLDIYMSFMGFRSRPTEGLYIDDAAYQKIEAQAGATTTYPVSCRVMIYDKPMWYLAHGIVVWDTGDKEMLVSLGIPGFRPSSVERNQVVILPTGAVLDC